MEIGINWNAYQNHILPDREQTGLLLKNGFSRTFVADDEQPEQDNLFRVLKESGIVCDTLHAPFSRINDIWRSGDDGERMAQRLIRSAQKCHTHEIPTLVVHLSSGDHPPRISDIGYKRFAHLVQRGSQLGIKIAFENQRKLANLAFALEQFPQAGFCWDAGHESSFAYGMQYLPLFGDRLVAVHLHDNDGIHNHDLHMIPYDCTMNFDRIAQQLAQVGYRGTIMLELHSLASERYREMPPEKYYAKAAAAASRLRDQVLKHC